MLPADGAERRGYSNLACGWRLQHVTVVARLHECSEACSYVWWGCCQRFAPPTVTVSLPRGTTFRSLGYATLTRDYAILPMLGRSYWPMLAMLSLPYTGYAHAILCWCFILAYSDSNMVDRRRLLELARSLACTNRISPLAPRALAARDVDVMALRPAQTW